MPRAPEFWAEGAASIWPALLAPLSALYGLGNRINRALTRPEDAGLPVISVGNLVAGGAGKTPTALALAKRLRALGHRPHFLTRGYGGGEAGPLRVEPARHDAAAVGDEALLLAEAAPTWVARRRIEGARAAKAAGATLVIADDAHQTYALARRLSFVVVDAAYGFGNGHLLPAGPLRESIAEGLARADAIILIGDGAGPALPASIPTFRARLEPDADQAAALKGKAVYAFAGIARPEKFFATLERLGAQVLGRESFPDHAPYTPDRIMRLVEAAHKAKAEPVTTLKDWARFPPEARAMARPLRVELEIINAAALDDFLQKALPHG